MSEFRSDVTFAGNRVEVIIKDPVWLDAESLDLRRPIFAEATVPPGPACQVARSADGLYKCSGHDDFYCIHTAALAALLGDDILGGMQ